MNWKHLIWIIPLLLIVGFGFGVYNVNYNTNLKAVNQFCQERGYDYFEEFERWNFENEEILSIICDESYTEAIPVYNEVFNKP